MSKKKSIVVFILSIAIIVGMCLVSAFGVTIDGMNKGSAKNITLGLELEGGVSVTFEAVGNPSEEDMEDTLYKLTLRANELTAESEVYREGDKRITVDIPGADNAEEVLKSLGKPGSLEFVTDVGTDKEKVWLTGADVEKAEAGYFVDDNNKTNFLVSLHFTPEATQTFAQVTKEFLYKPIYIVYDGEVVRSPYVSSVITGGQATIDGMKDFEDAEELASVIRIGALKVELKELTSKVVGAKLGTDAISTSLFAGLVGIVIVCIFMIIVYRIPGLASAIALVMYVALELLALNGFDMTLTLPGIAGIILSIGMAVDANVIIFARIKEELANDSENVMEAIKIGFKKATSAIVDGNVTTFIAAFVLMKLGTGPVQGFAETLAMGIAISMFTAMFVTRGLVYLLYHIGAKDAKYYGVQKERKTINFLSKKAIFFTISLITVSIGVAGLFVNRAGVIDDRNSELNYSVEFKGGLSTTVEFEKKYDIVEFNENALKDIIAITGDSDVVGNPVTDTNQYVIKTKELPAEVMTKVKAMLVEKYGAIESSFEEVSVSSTISGEMTKDAILAVCVSVVCMLIYIFFRFKNIGFASSAILALIHDVMVVLAFYVLSWTTVGNTFIACMLTILGYSINATIVIFDRIREELQNVNDNTELSDVVNKSITFTLTRTIYSSFTTFVMVAALYVFGVTAIKEFAMPLLVGILCGGYSSVCVTGALWYVMEKKKFAKNKYMFVKQDDED